MNRARLFLQAVIGPSKILGWVLVAVFWTVAAPALAQTAAPSADAEEVTRWLKANAVPLKGVQAGAAFDDLQPLKKVLKDVKVVGLGEATHGSREFFQFKHRMLEFLVKEMGFTVFALESSIPGCFALNDYVLHGTGDKAQALVRQGMGVWDTEEVTAVIDWMREYNKTAPEAKKVKLVGFDMQEYGMAYERLYPYLRRVAPEYAEKAGTDTLPTNLDWRQFLEMKDEPKQKVLAAVKGVVELLKANKDRFVKMTSAKEYDEAVLSARAMDQFTNSNKISRDSSDITYSRDYYMAKNVEHILNSEPPGTRVVVWAHNGHIALGQQAMGTVLRQTYGDAYYALGFSFSQGKFQAYNGDREDVQNQGLIEFNIGPAAEGSVDWYLARAGLKNYVIDFRLPQKPPQVSAWLAASHPMYGIGSVYSKKWVTRMYLRPIALKDTYDGLVFIDGTTRARQNPFPVR